MAILLLSDLHLPDTSSPLRDGFRRFLRGPAREAAAVYILGDLFEYWVGDDVGLRAYADEVRELRALSDAGVDLFFIAGNRDFLVGRRFFSATGVQALPDPSVVDLAGVPTLLSHGDLLCTDDLAYQRWRRFSRARAVRQLFALLPQRRRLAIAGGLRERSHGNGAQAVAKPAAIMDVNPDAAAAMLQRHGVVRLIHGHTHRPRTHELLAGGRAAERVVLADWTAERMEYLRIDHQGLHRLRV